MCAGMQDVDHRLTHDVDRLCLDLAELIPNMVRNCTDANVGSTLCSTMLPLHVLWLLAVWSPAGYITSSI